MAPSLPGWNGKLESVRGIAALVVVFSHCAAMLKVASVRSAIVAPVGDHPLEGVAIKLAQVMLDAQAAVVLFFVLSGYVLALSIQRSEAFTTRRYGGYLIRRAFRLMPALWIAILLLVVVRIVIHHPPDPETVGLRYHEIFDAPLMIRDIVANLALLDFTINPVTWSLYVEIVCSALLPVMMLVSRSRPAGLILLTALILVAVMTPDGPSALHYVFCFQLGLVLALYPLHIRGAVWLIALAIGLIAVERVLGLEDSPALLVRALAAGLVIAALASPSSNHMLSWLETTPLRLLGQTSYGLYLFHLTIIYLAIEWLHSSGLLSSGHLVPQILLVVVTAIATLALAWTVFRFVEQPFIATGRRLAQRYEAA